jgi:hypothetical protein
VQNDKERVDLTFEACSHLADLMARYSRIEAHYWKRKVENGRPLEDAMVRVYTAILVYAAEVHGSIESSISSQWPQFIRLQFIEHHQTTDGKILIFFQRGSGKASSA